MQYHFKSTIYFFFCGKEYYLLQYCFVEWLCTSLLTLYQALLANNHHYKERPVSTICCYNQIMYQQNCNINIISCHTGFVFSKEIVLWRVELEVQIFYPLFVSSSVSWAVKYHMIYRWQRDRRWGKERDRIFEFMRWAKESERSHEALHETRLCCLQQLFYIAMSRAFLLIFYLCTTLNRF